MFTGTMESGEEKEEEGGREGDEDEEEGCEAAELQLQCIKR